MLRTGLLVELVFTVCVVSPPFDFLDLFFYVSPVPYELWPGVEPFR